MKKCLLVLRSIDTNDYSSNTFQGFHAAQVGIPFPPDTISNHDATSANECFLKCQGKKTSDGCKGFCYNGDKNDLQCYLKSSTTYDDNYYRTQGFDSQNQCGKLKFRNKGKNSWEWHLY